MIFPSSSRVYGINWSNSCRHAHVHHRRCFTAAAESRYRTGISGCSPTPFSASKVPSASMCRTSSSPTGSHTASSGNTSFSAVAAGAVHPRQLTHLISTCPGTGHLADLTRSHASRLNEIHVAAIITRAAKLVQGGRGGRSQAIAVVDLVGSMIATRPTLLRAMQVRGHYLSSVLVTSYVSNMHVSIRYSPCRLNVLCNF